MGSVIAIASDEEPELSMEYLDQWEPKHLTKPSRHWKVGLVLQILDRMTLKSEDKLLKVQWLEKALDHNKIREELKGTYRVFKSTGATKGGNLPQVLVRTAEIAIVSALRVLPCSIEMVVESNIDDEFYLQADRQKWSLQFACPRRILNGEKTERDAHSNLWPALNASEQRLSEDEHIKPLLLQESEEPWLLKGYQQAHREKHRRWAKALKEQQILRENERLEKENFPTPVSRKVGFALAGGSMKQKSKPKKTSKTKKILKTKTVNKTKTVTKSKLSSKTKVVAKTAPAKKTVTAKQKQTTKRKPTVKKNKAITKKASNVKVTKHEPKYTKRTALLAKNKIIRQTPKVAKAIEKPKRISPESPKESRGHAFPNDKPFHIDRGRLRIFYPSFILELKSKPAMEVHMGDVVLVEVPGAKRPPMDTNWGGMYDNVPPCVLI